MHGIVLTAPVVGAIVGGCSGGWQVKHSLVNIPPLRYPWQMNEQATTPAPRPLGADLTYRDLAVQAAALFEGERDFIANAANLAALLFHSLGDVNWCGFYLLKGEELVLGPFQGKVACVRIPLGRGVCGASAASRKPLIVPDVDLFPGHIACDAASRSEVVVPLLAADGRLVGVIDVDSPALARFDEKDATGLQGLADLLLSASELSPPNA